MDKSLELLIGRGHWESGRARNGMNEAGGMDWGMALEAGVVMATVMETVSVMEMAFCNIWQWHPHPYPYPQLHPDEKALK